MNIGIEKCQSDYRPSATGCRTLTVLLAAVTVSGLDVNKGKDKVTKFQTNIGLIGFTVCVHNVTLNSLL